MTLIVIFKTLTMNDINIYLHSSFLDFLSQTPLKICQLLWLRQGKGCALGPAFLFIFYLVATHCFLSVNVVHLIIFFCQNRSFDHCGSKIEDNQIRVVKTSL